MRSQILIYRRTLTPRYPLPCDNEEFAAKVRKENGEENVILDETAFMVHNFALLRDFFPKQSQAALKRYAQFLIFAFQKYD